MRYLFFTFQSAKFMFGDDRKYDSVTKTHEKDESDDNIKEYKNEYDFITKHQVSGMIHKLFGSRPVSYYHKGSYSESDSLRSLAEKTFVKINNVVSYKNGKGEDKLYMEVMRTGKCMWNAHNPHIYTNASDGTVYKGDVTWHTLKRKYMLTKKFDTIRDFFLNDDIDINHPDEQKISLVDYLHSLKDSERYESYKEFFKNNMMTPLMIIMEHSGTNVSSFNANQGDNLAARTLMNGIGHYISLSGEFVIPISDNDFDNFKKYGTDCATFGDGGVVMLRDFSEHIDDEDAYIYEDEIIFGNDFNLITQD